MRPISPPSQRQNVSRDETLFVPNNFLEVNQINMTSLFFSFYLTLSPAKTLEDRVAQTVVVGILVVAGGAVAVVWLAGGGTWCARESPNRTLTECRRGPSRWKVESWIRIDRSAARRKLGQ